MRQAINVAHVYLRHKEMPQKHLPGYSLLVGAPIRGRGFDLIIVHFSPVRADEREQTWLRDVLPTRLMSAESRIIYVEGV